MLAARVARWSATGTMAWIDDFFAEQAALRETLAACWVIRGGDQQRSPCVLGLTITPQGSGTASRV